MITSSVTASQLKKALQKVKNKSDLVLSDLSNVDKNDLAGSIQKIIKFAKLFDECQGAGFHNSIYRGKNLGSVFTDEQKEAVRSGTFDDLFIGDYWEFNDVSYNWEDDDGSIQTSTWSGKMRVAHFNYHVGNWKHQLMIFPDDNLFSRKYSDTSPITVAYANSDIRNKKSGLLRAKELFTACFKENILTDSYACIYHSIVDGKQADPAWEYSIGCELLSEGMCLGSIITGNSDVSCPGEGCGRAINECIQVNLFRYHTRLVAGDFLLQDIVSSTKCAMISLGGRAYTRVIDIAAGVRPYFTVGF